MDRLVALGPYPSFNSYRVERFSIQLNFNIYMAPTEYSQ